ncbi:hypothetical protein BDZ45DRAFT_742925 [Acephala macrosclerotiorum]|nr:hypothetical protein BDZ45DRAFT_742925 [Acephala macrosclerotiorum]
MVPAQSEVDVVVDRVLDLSWTREEVAHIRKASWSEWAATGKFACPGPAAPTSRGGADEQASLKISLLPLINHSLNAAAAAAEEESLMHSHPASCLTLLPSPLSSLAQNLSDSDVATIAATLKAAALCVCLTGLAGRHCRDLLASDSLHPPPEHVIAYTSNLIEIPAPSKGAVSIANARLFDHPPAVIQDLQLPSPVSQFYVSASQLRRHGLSSAPGKSSEGDLRSAKVAAASQREKSVLPVTGRERWRQARLSLARIDERQHYWLKSLSPAILLLVRPAAVHRRGRRCPSLFNHHGARLLNANEPALG